MTYSAGPAVAMAAAQRAERKLIEALRVARALSAETAVPLVPDRWFGRAALKRLLRRKAVHEVGGRYWLDEDGYAAMHKAHHKEGVIIAVVLLAVLAAIMVLAIARQGGA